MSDDCAAEERVDELEDRMQVMEERYQDLEARYQALVTRNDTLKKLVLGDREPREDAVWEAPSVWEQVADLRSDVINHSDRMDRLDSAGARGQPGAARKAKIRHALVKRASRHGTATAAQATREQSSALDYEAVLALFDYEISKAYASQLLDKAAEDNPAFWVKKPTNPRDGRKMLRVELGELDEDSVYLREVRRGEGTDQMNQDFVRTVNNEHSQGGGSE